MAKLQTTITTVVVYPDRARVTRSGATALDSGSHRIEIPELPLRMDPASVRASARGSARARLLGVDVRRDFYVETPVEQVREMEEQVETLEDEVSSLEAQAELLTQERATLNELAGQTESFARGLAFGKTTAGDQMAFFDALRDRAEGLDAALLDLAVQKRDLERRLQKLRSELDQLRGAGKRERYTAVVSVELPQACELTVELSYVVSGAGWRPLYDVRLLEQEEKRALEFGYLAQVTQQTGEGWPDVNLTLSTARPALASTTPELNPWYVGPVRAVKRERKGAPKMTLAARAPSPEADRFSSGAEPGAIADQVEAEEVTARVERSGAAVTYQVPGKVDIPADGASHKVAVARFELAHELDYVTAPRLVEAAYRRAQADNDSPYTLLPGKANLFAQDEFIGATELKLIAPGGEIELYLGPDDRVRVQRELERRDVDRKFIGGRRRFLYGYQITLENLSPTATKILLHDQIPVPRHEEIKVKLESADPKPTERTELNLLNWELTLAPAEERVVRFDFTIECPREMSLVGLP